MLFSSLAKVVALIALSSQVALAAPHKKSKKTTTKKVAKTTAASSLQQQALSVHNKYRAKHHVAGLRWSQKLADHATKVTKTCVWGHSVVSYIKFINLLPPCSFNSLFAFIDGRYWSKHCLWLSFHDCCH